MTGVAFDVDMTGSDRLYTLSLIYSPIYNQEVFIVNSVSCDIVVGHGSHMIK